MDKLHSFFTPWHIFRTTTRFVFLCFSRILSDSSIVWHRSARTLFFFCFCATENSQKCELSRFGRSLKWSSSSNSTISWNSALRLQIRNSGKSIIPRVMASSLFWISISLILRIRITYKAVVLLRIYVWHDMTCLRRADLSSRGVLPTVVCPCVW
jgi:hypothetical protein